MTTDATARDRILSRLRKLKTLAESGAGGERTAAEAMLEEIALKHGIDLGALADDEGADAHEMEWPLAFKAGWRCDLFVQLAALLRLDLYGSTAADRIVVYRRFRRGSRKCTYYVRCTEGQLLELEAKFAVLEADYIRHLKAFYRAFLERNELLVPHEAGKPWPELSEEERANAELALSMSEGMEKSVLRKQLQDGRLAG